MKTCFYCSYPLLRHIRHSDAYWYCLHCRQEMPDISLDRLTASRYLLAQRSPSTSKDVHSIR